MNRSGQGITPCTSPYHGSSHRDKHLGCFSNLDPASQGPGPIALAIELVVTARYAAAHFPPMGRRDCDHNLVGCGGGLR